MMPSLGLDGKTMFLFCSPEADGELGMVQKVKDFGDGLRKNLGITVRCGRCQKRVIYRCFDFLGYIDPGSDIEMRVWRCTWCRSVATYVCYVVLDALPRQDLCRWTPPLGMKRRWP